jgi:hypothetical protein
VHRGRFDCACGSLGALSGARVAPPRARLACPTDAASADDDGPRTSAPRDDVRAAHRDIARPSASQAFGAGKMPSPAPAPLLALSLARAAF